MAAGGEWRPRAAAAGPRRRPARPRAARPGPGRRPGGRGRPRQPVRRPDRHRPGRRRPPWWPPPGPADPPCAWEFRLRPDARWSDGFRSAPPTSPSPGSAWPTSRRPPAPPRRPGPCCRGSPATGRSPPAGPARSPAWRPPTRPPWSSASTAPSPTSPPWSPPSRCPRSRGLVRPDPAAYLACPVGNGPFRLAAPARPGRALTLDRNPAYPGPPALLDKVSVHVVPDEQTAWLELQNGRVAFAPVPPTSSPPPAPSTACPTAAPARPPGPHPHHLAAHLQPEVEARRQPGLAPGRLLAIDRDQLATAMAGTAAATLVPPAPLLDDRRGRGRPGLPGLRPRPGQGPLPVRQGQAGRAPVTMAIPPAPTPAASPPWSPATSRRRGRRGAHPGPEGRDAADAGTRVAPTPVPTRSCPPVRGRPRRQAPPRPGPRHPRRLRPRHPLPPDRGRHPGRPPRDPPPHRAPRRRPHPRPPGRRPHPLGHPRPGRRQPPASTRSTLHALCYNPPAPRCTTSEWRNRQTRQVEGLAP